MPSNEQVEVIADIKVMLKNQLRQGLLTPGAETEKMLHGWKRSSKSITAEGREAQEGDVANRLIFTVER